MLGYDHDLPAAPQEAAVWQWAIAEAVEPPTVGLKRMMFKALWRYLLRDKGCQRRRSAHQPRPVPRPG